MEGRTPLSVAQRLDWLAVRIDELRRPDRAGISLLRSPVWPDPLADEGVQEVVYSLLPHPASWLDGGGMALRAYEPQGARGSVRLSLPDGWAADARLDPPERDAGPPTLELRPFEVVT